MASISYVNTTAFVPDKDVLQIMQEELESRSLGEFILETVLIALIMLASIFGNTLTLYIVYRNRSLRTTTNAFVVSLALSDLLMALMAITPALAVSIRSGWYFGRGFCLFQNYFIILTAPLSLVVIELNSINRYYKITKNNSYSRVFSKNRTMLMISSAWVVSFLLPLPMMHSNIVVFTPSKLMCFADFRNKWSIYITVLAIMIVGIALNIIAFCYLRIFITISNHQSNKFRSGTQSRANIQEIKITRMMFVLVLSFGVCWTPGCLVAIIDSFKGTFSLPRVAYIFHSFAAAVSCGINPIIYGLMNPIFRQEYLKLLKCSTKCGVNSVGPINE